MGIWDSEIVKVNGELYAFVRVQNDFTGNISGAFRRIYKDKNGYYCKVDGSNKYFNNQVEAFKKRDAEIKTAMEFYRQYGNLHGGYTRR